MFFVIFLATILRVISINQSLWLDEATSALVARMSFTDIFTKFLPGDFHPPLYYLILKLWTSVFGFSEISLRIPSVLFGIAAIFVVYLIAKKLFDAKVGVISAVLLSTSGLAVYYSQEARMYMLALLFVSLAFYWFLERKWGLFSIALLLIGMTDYVSLFIIPVFFIVGWKERKKIVLGLVPLVAGFLIWLPVFLKQLAVGASVQGTAWWNILGTASLKNIGLIPVKFVIGRISFDSNVVYGIVIAVSFLLFGYLLIKALKAPGILWAWLVIPVSIGILVSLKIPTLTYFRFIFCLPAFYILISAGLEKAGGLKYIFLGLILGVNVLSSGYYLLNYRFQREDWRAAAKAVGSDKIVFPSDSHKEALIYYGKASQAVSIYDIAPGDRELWLSRYVWEIDDPTDSVRLKIEKLGYNKTKEDNFNGVVFFKYTKNQYASRD